MNERRPPRFYPKMRPPFAKAGQKVTRRVSAHLLRAAHHANKNRFVVAGVNMTKRADVRASRVVGRGLAKFRPTRLMMDGLNRLSPKKRFAIVGAIYLIPLPLISSLIVSSMVYVQRAYNRERGGLPRDVG